MSEYKRSNDIENPSQRSHHLNDSNHTLATSNRKMKTSTGGSRSEGPPTNIRSNHHHHHHRHHVREPINEEEAPISLPYPNDDASAYDHQTISSAGTVSELSFAHSLSDLMSIRTERTDDVNSIRHSDLLNQVTQRSVLPATSFASTATSRSNRSLPSASKRHNRLSSGAMSLPTHNTTSTDFSTNPDDISNDNYYYQYITKSSSATSNSKVIDHEKDLMSPESGRTDSTRTSGSEHSGDFVRSDLDILPEEDDDESVKATILDDEASCCMEILQSIGCQCILILLLFGLIGFMIAVIALMARGKLDTFGSSEDPIMEGEFVEPLEVRLFETLSVTTRTALADPVSPQAQAFAWLVEYDMALENSLDGALTEVVPDWKIQQLFSLVTFYYNYGGEEWPQQKDWLSFEVTECDWDSRAIQCHPNGTIQELKFDPAISRASLPTEVEFLPHLEKLTLNDVEFTAPDWPN